MSRYAFENGLAIGTEYGCESCGGTFEVGRYHCDVGHRHCHDGDKELTAPTLADHPQPEAYTKTPSGLLVATPYGVSLRQR